MLAFDARDGLEIDRPLRDGDTIEATEFVLRALHTPGHASNHLCFLLEQERMLFSGDHIMEGSTVVIRPPDGDMAAYLAAARAAQGAAPPPPVDRARPRPPHRAARSPRSTSTSQHRAQREAQIVACLRTPGPRSPSTPIVAELYTDTPEELLPMAAATVWAHLRKLKRDGQAQGTLADGSWSATS